MNEARKEKARLMFEEGEITEALTEIWEYYRAGIDVDIDINIDEEAGLEMMVGSWSCFDDDEFDMFFTHVMEVGKAIPPAEGSELWDVLQQKSMQVTAYFQDNKPLLLKAIGLSDLPEADLPPAFH